MRAFRRLTLVLLGLTVWSVPTAGAQVTFTDNFNSGPSALWSNGRGSWFTSGGKYDSHLPSNVPPTFSLLPYDLTDFSISVTIAQLQDGGIWLRSLVNAQTNEIFSGVLLVTGGLGQTGNGLYWHTVTNGQYSGILNGTNGLFTSGTSTARIRVDVSGDTYSAFVDNAAAPATTLATSPGQYAHGLTGLYDYSNQTFDDVTLTGNTVAPEPASFVLLATGLAGIGGVAVRRRRR